MAALIHVHLIVHVIIIVDKLYICHKNKRWGGMGTEVARQLRVVPWYYLGMKEGSISLRWDFGMWEGLAYPTCLGQKALMLLFSSTSLVFI
jgi:hypothetical protein